MTKTGFREARERAGMRVTEAARRLRVSSPAVTQWENGSTIPRADRLMQIAELYGCTVDELLREEAKR